jgi:hypothetical protein
MSAHRGRGRGRKDALKRFRAFGRRIQQWLAPHQSQPVRLTQALDVEIAPAPFGVGYRRCQSGFPVLDRRRQILQRGRMCVEPPGFSSVLIQSHVLKWEPKNQRPVPVPLPGTAMPPTSKMKNHRGSPSHFGVVEPRGVEPLTSSLRTTRSTN